MTDAFLSNSYFHPFVNNILELTLYKINLFSTLCFIFFFEISSRGV